MIREFIFLSRYDILLITFLNRFDMSFFRMAFYSTGILYAIFCQQVLFLLFFAFVLAYSLISKFIKGENVDIRRKVFQAFWEEPSGDHIRVRVRVRVQKVEDVIQEYRKKGVKLTMTHFAIKAVGQILKAVPQINGILSFGKVKMGKFSLFLCRR